MMSNVINLGRPLCAEAQFREFRALNSSVSSALSSMSDDEFMAEHSLLNQLVEAAPMEIADEWIRDLYDHEFQRRRPDGT